MNTLNKKEVRNRKRRELKNWFNSFKEDLCCIVCYEDRPLCLDFHHMDTFEKDKEVSRLVHDMNPKAVLKEMKKCVTLCSNCHRLVHAGQLKITSAHKKMFDLALETVLRKEDIAK